MAEEMDQLPNMHSSPDFYDLGAIKWYAQKLVKRAMKGVVIGPDAEKTLEDGLREVAGKLHGLANSLRGGVRITGLSMEDDGTLKGTIRIPSWWLACVPRKIQSEMAAHILDRNTELTDTEKLWLENKIRETEGEEPLQVFEVVLKPSKETSDGS